MLNDLIPFLLHHYLLSAAFIVLLAAVIYVETASLKKGSRKVSIPEAIQLMNRQQALVVDLREEALYKAGHIAGSLNIKSSELKDHKQLASKKDRPIILVCANGTLSASSAAQLSQAGCSQAYHLAGGIAAWKADNLPLQSTEKK